VPYISHLISVSALVWEDGGNEDQDTSGHALRSLEAALWAFGSTDGFEACVLAAVNLGNDADTVGAIAGQLAGAHYGLEGIPEALISGLQQAERFTELAERLATHDHHDQTQPQHPIQS
jgi:ADP-ribosylglycohydrolase